MEEVRYHINSKGSVERCHAQLGNCPFEIDGHYPTKELAEEALEKRELQKLKEKQEATKIDTTGLAMKPIMSHSEEEIKALAEVQNNLSEKIRGLTADERFTKFYRSNGSSRYTFSGTIGDKLIERLGRDPTPDELVILIDRGFSHFGASCWIDGKNFGGYVYTD